MEYKRIKLLNGIVVVPNDTKLSKSTMSEKSNYAAIVTERGNRVKKILCLLEKPLSTLSKEEMKELTIKVAKDFPYMIWFKVRETRPMIIGNRLINVKKWQRSPHIGIFPISEVKDMEHLDCSTGIIREV